MKIVNFKQICGAINYNTYNDIKNGIGLFGTGLELINSLSLEHSLLSNSQTTLLVCLCISAYLGLELTNGSGYTKDINEIRELYNVFLENYIKLNKYFALKDPIEIYTMFNYLLHRGYLSKSQHFQISSKSVANIKGLRGVNVLNGYGMDDHISVMFVDILNTLGFNAAKLNAYSKKYNLNQSLLEQQDNIKEDLNKWVKNHITDEQISKMAKTMIDENINIKNSDVLEKYLKYYNIYVMSFIIKENCGYLFDPIQTKIYKIIDLDKYTLVNSNKKRNSNNFLTTNLGKVIINQKLHCDTISLTDEEQQLMNRTLSNCDDNIDIIENFYNKNSSLYDDISYKLSKIIK